MLYGWMLSSTNPLIDFCIQVSYLKQEFDKAEAELKRSREQMKECDSRISYIVKEQQKLQQRLSDANLERKKMENEVILIVSFVSLLFLFVHRS